MHDPKQPGANESGRSRPYQFLATATWFAGMGWAIAVSVVVGLLAGNWIDGRAGQHPLFLLIGLVVGLALGLFAAGRMLMRFVSTGG